MSAYRPRILKLWSVRVGMGIRFIDFCLFRLVLYSVLLFFFLWIRIFLLFFHFLHTSPRCTLVVCFALTNPPVTNIKIVSSSSHPLTMRVASCLPSPMSSNHSHRTSSRCISFLFTKLAVTNEDMRNGRSKEENNFSFFRVIARYIFSDHFYPLVRAGALVTAG